MVAAEASTLTGAVAVVVVVVSVAMAVLEDLVLLLQALRANPARIKVNNIEFFIGGLIALRLTVVSSIGSRFIVTSRDSSPNFFRPGRRVPVAPRLGILERSSRIVLHRKAQPKPTEPDTLKRVRPGWIHAGASGLILPWQSGECS